MLHSVMTQHAGVRGIAASRSSEQPSLRQHLHAPCRNGCNLARQSQQRLQACRSTENDQKESGKKAEADTEVTVGSIDLNKEVSKFARNAATNFAPRQSGAASKNPAYPGSTLYEVFTYQAYISIVVGGLLSFNVIFPSNQPDISRLLGMWSLWIFTVPSLRARDCSKPEKDALNLLFLGIPLLNVLLPFVWKDFGFIFAMDVVALAAAYAWKVWLPSGEEESQEP